MADIFSFQDARNLLRDKFVFMLGDSNIRATYKDLVLLISQNQILDMVSLRKRGEESFQGDKRIVYEGLSKGRHYVEGREYVEHGVHIEYHFITRCYTNEIETFFKKMKDGSMKTPDVIIMNSCIWDITRWGPNGVKTFKENMKNLMVLLDQCMPKSTLFIWTTALPVSTDIRGGLLIKQIDFLQNVLRFEIMEANLFCRDLLVSHGYDILDTHYHLRMQIHRRLRDGLHYGPLPVRFISNLILTHIALSWSVPLPGNSHGIVLKKIIESGCLNESGSAVEPPPTPGLLDTDVCIDDGRNQNIYNRPIARGKRRQKFKRGNFNPNLNNVRPKPRKPPPPAWRNDYSDWGQHNQSHMETQAPKYWQFNGNNQFNGHNQRYPVAPGPPAPQWNEYTESNNYCHSEYADFDRVGGPMRKNLRFHNKRCAPY